MAKFLNPKIAVSDPIGSKEVEPGRKILLGELSEPVFSSVSKQSASKNPEPAFSSPALKPNNPEMTHREMQRAKHTSGLADASFSSRPTVSPLNAILSAKDDLGLDTSLFANQFNHAGEVEQSQSDPADLPDWLRQRPQTTSNHLNDLKAIAENSKSRKSPYLNSHSHTKHDKILGRKFFIGLFIVIKIAIGTYFAHDIASMVVGVTNTIPEKWRDVVSQEKFSIMFSSWKGQVSKPDENVISPLTAEQTSSNSIATPSLDVKNLDPAADQSVSTVPEISQQVTGDVAPIPASASEVNGLDQEGTSVVPSTDDINTIQDRSDPMPNTVKIENDVTVIVLDKPVPPLAPATPLEVPALEPSLPPLPSSGVELSPNFKIKSPVPMPPLRTIGN